MRSSCVDESPERGHVSHSGFSNVVVTFFTITSSPLRACEGECEELIRAHLMQVMIHFSVTADSRCLIGGHFALSPDVLTALFKLGAFSELRRPLS